MTSLAWTPAAVLTAAAGTSVWAPIELAANGIERPVAALAFGGLVAVGELARLSYPAKRVQAPLGLAGGLAYGLLCARAEGFDQHSVAQTVVVVGAGMLVGSAPHFLVGRELGLLSMARRLLLVWLVTALYCLLLASEALAASWRGAMALEALVMIGVLGIGFVVDWCLRAALVAGQNSTPLWRHVVIEAGVAPGIEASVIATAVALAMATSIMGLWAIPLFSIPLLLTQSSYRRFQAARTTYAQTIEALSRSTELAGFTVVGHARRVADLSAQLGRSLGLGPHELTDLEHAALLHDLGQMALAEPLPRGDTTSLPLEQRRRIAATGAELLEEAQIRPRVAAAVGRQADTWDGPVRRSDLPIASRILAVANAYDDLTAGDQAPAATRRALSDIQAGAGHAYDNDVVQALDRIVEAPVASTSRNRALRFLEQV